MTEFLKTSAYDLPIKTLSLGSGVDKVLTSAQAPVLDVEDDDALKLTLFGSGVRSGDSFAPAKISYAALKAMFAERETHTFSAKNDFFGYRSETGRLLPLSELVNALYGAGSFDPASAPEEAEIIVSSGLRQVKLRLGSVYAERYYYPLLTSEQILAGMNPADSRGETLEPGLLLTDADELLFVIGQRNWNDMNEANFVKLVQGGAVISLAALPESRKAHSVLYVGPLGGKLGEDVIAYPAVPGSVARVTAKEGSLIRFNLDCDDLLNTVHYYYKFTLDGAPCSDPAPNDGFVYNTRIPLYFGGGADYPSGIVLPKAAEHNRMTIRMLATGAGCPDSEIDTFEIEITE